ncbi:translation initiation factor IF-2 [Vitis riparia]|uniref:translation initiation factor IF-2 n=1 Tax=Vitis riparia TaxID=96939 RepID=UPI00155A42E5|nr:translation initiation factor IF-2 [Vitis riparia]
MAVAASRNTLHRYSAEILKPTLTQTLSLRFNSTSTHSTHQDHTYTDPNSFIGSWKAPADPKVAQAKLAGLRRDYAKKVKELRLQYIHEVELQREDKRRKDEAKREAARRAQAEIKASKAAAAQARAAERKVFEEEFRQTLLKERTEKLENWRMKENMMDEKRKEKNELLRRQSSIWIDERDLEKKILEAIVDTTHL